MAASSVRIASIYWDGVLDQIDAIIPLYKCICCRMSKYNEMLNLSNAEHTTEFEHVEQLVRNLQELLRKTRPQHIRRRCHRHSDIDKWTKREFAAAESRLVVALHFHPLVDKHHICYMQYATATHYGVELTACDHQDLVTRDTMNYICILQDVRKLFR